ncbi:unnamed protein product [Schistocephalus solidus]|uniref:Transmembrane protein n=1 Tax=Schistocephalus solidus TaxID=70667 RepID=A0A183SJT1_SCHSO|nr:unnamed protein product [Schistocephalus solidus]
MVSVHTCHLNVSTASFDTNTGNSSSASSPTCLAVQPIVTATTTTTTSFVRPMEWAQPQWLLRESVYTDADLQSIYRTVSNLTQNAAMTRKFQDKWRSHRHLRTDAESVNSHTFDVPRAASSEPGFSHLRDSAITPASGTLDTCEEILESLDVSENGVSNTEVVTVSEPKPPHLSLAPFFERTLANRKAAPNAGTRANEEIVMRATDSIQNAPPNSERDINENISKTHKDSRTQTTGNSMQVVGNIEEVGPQSSEVETNSRLGLFWRGALLPGGILTLTLLGAILAVELDVHAPLLDGLRSSSPFAAWEQHCYRPLRSLIFGLFHH